MVYYSDYYPFGSPLTLATNASKVNYQKGTSTERFIHENSDTEIYMLEYYADQKAIEGIDQLIC